MRDSNTPSGTEYLTADEVAAILRVSKSYVLRNFADLPGVINLGTKEKMHKRPYRVLRIPRSTLNNFLAQKRSTSG
ncbi:MAG: helix-turn-helix domain-containing protein [Candidatus Acidiferrales bacterium]